LVRRQKNGEQSKYKDWFYVDNYPVQSNPSNYVTFGFFGAMPKFNTSNPEVVKYLVDAARHWVAEFDIDGWRLDVANEIDHKFWRKFCRAVRKVKPDCFVLGELWHNALLWINGAEFDSTMHYPLIWKIEELIVKQGKPSNFANQINEILHWYPEVVSHALFILLSSQDTIRIFTRCNEDVNLTKLFFLLQFTHPGSPCIWYGDEIAMPGGLDPDCRACMQWHPEKQNTDFRKYVQKLIAIRKKYSALKTGTLKFIETNDPDKFLVYKRENDTETIVVVLNVGTSPLHVCLTGTSESELVLEDQIWNLNAGLTAGTGGGDAPAIQNNPYLPSAPKYWNKFAGPKQMGGMRKEGNEIMETIDLLTDERVSLDHFITQPKSARMFYFDK